MNKKIKILLIAAVSFLVLAVIIYFLVLPRFANTSDVVDNQELEDNSIPIEGVDLMADGTDGFEIDSDVGESEILPLEDNSDPALGDGDMAVDFDLLTDDQRTRILAGELTMDELKAEMNNGENNSDKSSETSTPTLINATITDINNGVTSQIGVESNTSLVDSEKSENLEDGINFGEPDVQTDTMIPTLSAVDDTVNNTSTDSTTQEKNEEITETPKEGVEKVTQEVDLDTTYDSNNLHGKWILVSLFAIFVIRFVFYRRLHL